MQAPSSTTDKSAAPWHALASQDVLRALDASAEGLSAERAASRLREHGRNELPAAKQRSPFIEFASQFNNALIYFLLAAALLAAVLGHHVDASVILLVVIVNAIVGFVQEGRAEQALSALRAMLAPSARVLRDGRRQAVAVAAVIVDQLMFTYTPWMQRLFDTRAVPLLEGLAILGCGIVLFVILEFEKALLRRPGGFEELQVRRSPHDPPAAEPATLGRPTGPVP